MKIKIIKCSESQWWYSDKIGEVFDDVRDYGELDFMVTGTIICEGKPIPGGGCILKTDVIIIPKGLYGMPKYIEKHSFSGHG
jgi:hypothetical protein